jgi:hypothetical protein
MPLVAFRLKPVCRGTQILTMKNALVCLTALLIGSASVTSLHGNDSAKIREGMSKLAPLVGKWDATVKFYDPDGTITEEVGTDSISFVLDGSYLECELERHNKENPKRSNSLISFITFNPALNQYDTTYFYRGSALRVTETGAYDSATREFRTQAFIPLEDGVHDENVRTITSLKDPEKIVHTHFSKRSNETCERVDLMMTLTRTH